MVERLTAVVSSSAHLDRFDGSLHRHDPQTSRYSSVREIRINPGEPEFGDRN
jgi:hypothetical protein